jgi:hypothetical protein
MRKFLPIEPGAACHRVFQRHAEGISVCLTVHLARLSPLLRVAQDGVRGNLVESLL